MARRFLHSIITFLSLLMGCVEEQDLPFPDGRDEYAFSIALHTFVNTLTTDEFLLDENQIEYPIELRFNNDITITIANNQGFLEAVNSQSSQFYLSSIAFPIIINGETLASENDLLAFLQQNGLLTFREDLLDVLGDCFLFEYPVSLVDSQGDSVLVEDDLSLEAFVDQQDFLYQPNLIFPVQITQNTGQITWDNYYDAYQTLNTCPRCPELFLDTFRVAPDRYTFVVQNESIDEVRFYQWYLNSTLIDEDTLINDVADSITLTLPPGLNEICVYTATDRCEDGVQVCTEVFVEDDPCPQLSFTTREENPSTYSFFADFPERDNIFYEWVILVNGDLLYSESEPPGGDNTLFFQFAPGTYDICIQTETPECPQGIRYCEQLVVN